MDTELQTESVYIIGQSLESDTVGSRRKAVECRRIAAVLIVYIDRVGLVITSGLVIFYEPADVDHHVFPAIGSQVLGHVVGIGFDFTFYNRRTVTVP